MAEPGQVIYAGAHGQPDGVVEAAVQEDADALALSIVSGDRMVLVPRVLELLPAVGAGDVGGAITSAGATELERLGLTAVVTSGTEIQQVGTFLRCSAGPAALCP